MDDYGSPSATGGAARPALHALPARMLRSISVMADANELTEQQEDRAMGSEPAPPIQSRFLFVDVAALRAKQLRRGAQPRLERADAPAPLKAERLAMEEVRRGLVSYDVPAYRPASRGSEA